jgi:hypothetical protein
MHTLPALCIFAWWSTILIRKKCDRVEVSFSELKPPCAGRIPRPPSPPSININITSWPIATDPQGARCLLASKGNGRLTLRPQSLHSQSNAINSRSCPLHLFFPTCKPRHIIDCPVSPWRRPWTCLLFLSTLRCLTHRALLMIKETPSISRAASSRYRCSGLHLS